MYHDGKSGSRDAAVAPNAARQRAYRVARSHSGRVRKAKRALPIIGGVILVVVIGAIWISRIAPGAGIDVASTAIRGGKLVMSNPKLDGRTSENRPYSVSAARAIQDLTGSDVIDLERLQASVPIDDTVSARISANAGTYDSEANRITMRDSITVVTTDGTTVEMDTADIDIASGSLTTPDPVRITTQGASIEADRLTVENNGKRLVFESRVKLVIQPDEFQPAGRLGQSSGNAGAQTGE